MLVKQIKIGFTDTFQTAINFWIDTLSKRYDVIKYNGLDPDLLIFGDSNFGNNHGLYHCKKLFYTGENVRPNWNECDWACTFDHINSPKHYRLPLYVLEMHEMVSEGYPKHFLYINEPLLNSTAMLDDLWNRGFCSFVQSNPNVPERNEFFHYLNYKMDGVSSAGPLFNNTNFILPRTGGHKAKIDFISEFKFNIAFENGSYPGYVTEKLLNAFYANTIPIYWGSELVGRDFNKKAFIDANDFYNKEELVDYVLEINSDKNKYLKMLTQPCFHDNIVNEYSNIDNLLNWFDQNVYKEIKK